MTKTKTIYEYQTVQIPPWGDGMAVVNHQRAEDTMNEFAEEGWRVQSLGFYEKTAVIVFEREVE